MVILQADYIAYMGCVIIYGICYCIIGIIALGYIQHMVYHRHKLKNFINQQYGLTGKYQWIIALLLDYDFDCGNPLNLYLKN